MKVCFQMPFRKSCTQDAWHQFPRELGAAPLHHLVLWHCKPICMPRSLNKQIFLALHHYEHPSFSAEIAADPFYFALIPPKVFHCRIKNLNGSTTIALNCQVWFLFFSTTFINITEESTVCLPEKAWSPKSWTKSILRFRVTYIELFMN